LNVSVAGLRTDQRGLSAVLAFNCSLELVNAYVHSRRGPQALVLAHEVVVREAQRYSGAHVFQLLREAVGQPREFSHAHAHGEVLALDDAGRDMARIAEAQYEQFDQRRKLERHREADERISALAKEAKGLPKPPRR
jgi:hypothetical protein